MKRPHLSTLAADGKTPVPVSNILEWGEGLGTARNTVAHTVISDDVEVSTIFLGLDYNVLRAGPPLLWETMIFGGRHNHLAARYTSYEAAVAGHDTAVQLARER